MEGGSSERLLNETLSSLKWRKPKMESGMEESRL